MIAVNTSVVMDTKYIVNGVKFIETFTHNFDISVNYKYF